MDKFYKLIHEGNFIGVCTSSEFCRFQKKRRILLLCDENLGQYVSYKDTLYRDSWMVPVTSDSIDYINCSVIEISKDVYDNLHRAIENNENVEIETEVIPEVKETEVVNEDNTLEFVKSSKISEMRSICNKSITNGFDVVLSDGNNHHFSLTVYDQLNLLSMMAYGNNSNIFYHADGEHTTIYSADDAKLIFDKFMNLKTYHTTYFTAIKDYINSLTDIDIINKVEYGMEIPGFYFTRDTFRLDSILNG